jgi:Protein of unknown function (DUF4058)
MDAVGYGIIGVAPLPESREEQAMPVHNWTRVSAGIFHHFHLEWIAAISRSLNSGLLPDGYYALAEQVAGGREPDVLALEDIRQRPVGGNGSGPESEGGRGGIAVTAAPPRVRFTAQAEIGRYALKRRRIGIRHSSDDRVVALVEIVSPGNKDRTAAVRDFAEKAVEFLDSGIHLLIIDLFPPTASSPQGLHRAIWSHFMTDTFEPPPNEPLALMAYAAGPIKRAYVEPAAVGKPLPDMPLFLEPEMYVPVPLEATYAAAFADVPKRWRDELEAGGGD